MKLIDVIKEILNEDSPATQQAKQMGLVYKQFGRWADPKTNKVTHKTQGDRLVPVDPSQGELPLGDRPWEPDPKGGRGLAKRVGAPHERPEREKRFAKRQQTKKTVSKIVSQMKSHDWNYEYSDDHSVWTKGRRSEKELVDTMAASGFSKDQLKNILSKAAPNREQDFNKLWKMAQQTRVRMNIKGKVPGQPHKYDDDRYDASWPPNSSNREPVFDPKTGKRIATKGSGKITDPDAYTKDLNKRISSKKDREPGDASHLKGKRGDWWDEPSADYWDKEADKAASADRGERGLDMDPLGQKSKSKKINPYKIPRDKLNSILMKKAQSWGIDPNSIDLSNNPNNYLVYIRNKNDARKFADAYNRDSDFTTRAGLFRDTSGKVPRIGVDIGWSRGQGHDLAYPQDREPGDASHSKKIEDFLNSIEINVDGWGGGWEWDSKTKSFSYDDGEDGHWYQAEVKPLKNNEFLIKLPDKKPTKVSGIQNVKSYLEKLESGIEN